MDWFHITYALINAALVVTNIMLAKLGFKSGNKAMGILGVLLAIACFGLVIANVIYAFSGGK